MGYSEYRSQEQIARSTIANANTSTATNTDQRRQRDQAGAGDMPEKKQLEMWHYQDTNGIVQGPFPSDQMEAWRKAGFFPPNTPVRKVGGVVVTGNGGFVPIGSVTLTSQNSGYDGQDKEDDHDDESGNGEEK